MPPATGPLNVLSPDAESVFQSRVAAGIPVHRAGSLSELHAVLESLRGPGSVRDHRSLDLVGHSTAGHHLLRLGTTPVDMLDPAVARFFRALAGTELLPALGIIALRLLGCQTAVTDAGRRTVRMLSRTLRLPVYGTLVPLLDSHWRVDGFDPTFSHVLVEAAQLS